MGDYGARYTEIRGEIKIIWNNMIWATGYLDGYPVSGSRNRYRLARMQGDYNPQEYLYLEIVNPGTLNTEERDELDRLRKRGPICGAQYLNDMICCLPKSHTGKHLALTANDEEIRWHDKWYDKATDEATT